LHQGAIWAENIPEGGVCVHLCFRQAILQKS